MTVLGGHAMFTDHAFMMSTFGLALFLACTPSALLDFAIPKWKADKNFEIRDAYKWMYQATRGGEHAVPDEASARKWMESEWNSLGETKANEPIWAPLCPGDQIGRLNLRPFKEKGGKSDDLLTAFLASSREYRSDAANFVAAWKELGKRLGRRKVGKLDHSSWLKLNAEMSRKDYPAVHHSEKYNRANHPAYRIITSAEMKKLLTDRQGPLRP